MLGRSDNFPIPKIWLPKIRQGRTKGANRGPGAALEAEVDFAEHRKGLPSIPWDLSRTLWSCLDPPDLSEGLTAKGLKARAKDTTEPH